MRRGFLGTVVIVIMLVGSASPVRAASVSIIDYAFTPNLVKIAQGDTVSWTNDGDVGHTSTQDGPLALWHSGAIAPGASSSVTLPAAGTYAYHCNVHVGIMTGTVRVPLIVDQTTGTTATIFTFTLASETQYGYVHDVQKKRLGRWHDWKTGVVGPTVEFQAVAAGTVRFRSRLHRSSDDAVSGWSPRATIVVS
ncbi:MAG TPA: plastocyanin/azurin family copper-binding protein [Actinomycetota bacterium]|jgi:plastocyanin|nr:plastocyanin/azurin family copper-binding protein [Actinomycetota bacterium]